MVNLMAKNPFTTESVEFDTPANRIIQQLQPRNEFRLNNSLPDITYLRQLAVQGRLRFFNASLVGTGDIITVIPPDGETFFFLKANILNAHTTTLNYDIVNAGISREIMYVPTVTTQSFFTQLDSLVGNGTDSFIITRSSAGVTGTSRAFMMGWVENTARIRDVAT